MPLVLAADVTIPSYTISHGFDWRSLLIGLVWAVWVVLNLWIWKKSKAQSNLLMLIGSAVLTVTYILRTFTWDAPGFWIEFFALLALSAGFFLSVRPLVEAHLAALKAKLGGGKGGGTPPPA